MSSSIFLKATGLQKSPNQLSLPEGALVEASNIIIKRSNVIESRRGFKTYGTTLPSPSDICKQLMTYKQRILRHFNTTIQYDSDGLGTFLPFAGSYSEVTPGLRIKYIEANGNLYFTTNRGIQKISAVTAADFTTASGFITPSGGIKALDISGRPITISGGFLPADSKVAYRVVWGTKDINGNLILGTPSARIEVSNPLIGLSLTDFSTTLQALDYIGAAGSAINNQDYITNFNLPQNASADELYANLGGLVSELDNNIKYADTTGGGVFPYPLKINSIAEASGVVTITFDIDPTPYFVAGQKIFLSGFTSGAGTVNGAQTIATVNSGPKTITFAATVTAPAVSAGKIVSNTFRSIATPPAPSTPATHADIAALQNQLSEIMIALQNEPNSVISTSVLNQFIVPLDITTASEVEITITIPPGVTSAYFYQLYRTATVTATGTDVLSELSAGDEMGLVIEAYPTSAELAAEQVIVIDNTPDSFRGANLYTNQISGEGILAANDLPPIAKDINRFKNVIFFANTTTRFRLNSSLLGVSTIITDALAGLTPSITITDGTTTNTYTFVVGKAEITTIATVADVADSLNGKYFLLNAANDTTEYYVWYKTSGGVASDPAIAGKTGIEVLVPTGATANQVASATSATLNSYIDSFSNTVSTNTITNTNVDGGNSTDATAGTSGFTVTVTQQGVGENAAAKQVLLSSAVSPAQAVDETARSLLRVINKNTGEIVSGFYLSGPTDVPGKMLFESRAVGGAAFYILGSTANVGNSFNPTMTPTIFITSVGTGLPATVTTSSPHGLVDGDIVIISGSNSTPSIDGRYVIDVTGASTFTVPVNVTIAGTNRGGIALASDLSSFGDNEVRPNRIYYSKYSQPEAVPLLNFLDVGAKDAEILRIFPIRDSLFVFKEDGLFRISGEIAPFTLALFDTSCNLLAADSLGVANNLIYGWTSQGLSIVSEAGVSTISRPIDVDILKLASASYTNFDTATWGVGYDSDNSYTVYTVKKTTDTLATIGYRYSNLTDSWTTIDKTVNCGVVLHFDDKLYLGPADISFTEQERKNFDRTDYADRQWDNTIVTAGVIGTQINLPTVAHINVGDVLVQDQTVTVYEYNMLLKKLDIDTSLTDGNYYSTLIASAGNNMSLKLDALISKVAADAGRLAQPGRTSPGTYTALEPTGSTFALLKTNFNAFVVLLNADPGLAFSNYVPNSNNSALEVIITAVNIITRQITVNLAVDLIAGVITTYNAINCTFTYGPLTMGDSLGLKHMREATVMFETRSFTSGILSFASDLLPMFNDVPFDLDGNGIFGYSGNSEGFGSKYFGGASNSAPFRTLIPRNNMRCRYLVVKMKHSIAREIFNVFGITITGETGESTRAYR